MNSKMRCLWVELLDLELIGCTWPSQRWIRSSPATLAIGSVDPVSRIEKLVFTAAAAGWSNVCEAWLAMRGERRRKEAAAATTTAAVVLLGRSEIQQQSAVA